MNYDRFFIINCWMGDEMYRKTTRKNKRALLNTTEKQFNLLSQKPLDQYIRSGMPWLRAW